MGAPGRVLSRTRLCEEVAGRDYETFDRSIDVHVAGPGDFQPGLPETRRGASQARPPPRPTRARGCGFCRERS